ncbi:MAG: TonB family protein [Bacteroidales bacterium]|nr:TonB family protein [Bacteroidales bacterium]
MNAQQLIIGHLLPITAGIVVLWLVYRLLFSNGNRLQFNRLFLLTAMLFSLALPFIGLQMGQSAPQVVHLKQNLLGGTLLAEITVMPEGGAALPEVEVAPDAPQKAQINGWRILGGIYLIGVAVTALLFLFKIAKLVVLIIRSSKEKREGYTAVFLSKVPEPAEKPTDRIAGPSTSSGTLNLNNQTKVPEPVEGPTSGSFSFFRYAFFPNESVAPDIVRHERSHISHGHSADILFVETMKILQWFNPFIYLYKKELQSLHEYQADRDVVATGVDKRNYMMLILQQCTATDFSGISNNFSLILTKKRIKMITRNEKAKGLWWRLLATLPALAMLLIVNTKVSAQEQSAEKKPITVEMGQFEIFDDDGAPIRLKDTIIYNEDGTYFKFETSDAFDPMNGEPRKKITVTSYNADGTPANSFKLTEMEKHGDTVRYDVEPFSIYSDALSDKIKITTDEDLNVKVKHQSNDSIFQIVDQMPEFPGGTDEMMHFVASNIKYPQDAIDEGKGGRVFVSFVVEKDGLVSNVKVLKGVCESIDEEAARVIRGMPRWKPGMKDGKPARVSFQMPITFNLGQTNGEHKTTVRTVIAEDESGEHSRKVSTATYPDNPVEDKMQPDKDGVFQIVEEMPQFPGGEPKLMEYIAKNLNYPQEARDKGIDGRVFIGMVIEKDGSVSNVKVLRGIGGGCDEEAVRVIKALPKWTPGKKDGKPARVSYQIPINFKLTEQQPKKN